MIFLLFSPNLYLVVSSIIHISVSHRYWTQLKDRPRSFTSYCFDTVCVGADGNHPVLWLLAAGQ